MTNHPNRTKVITWQAPNGQTIDLTRSQERQLRRAGVWPRNSRGEEYCTVSHGLHVGEAADIEQWLRDE
jgi:hypothetical protein